MQLRLERLLRMADWRPPGMKPGAILLVRRVRGLPPLAGYGAWLPVAWEGHLRERLTALYASAARPQFGPVPLDAESILFESPAELLVCLTRDALQAAPGAPQGWHWRQLARSQALTSGGAGLAVVWAQQAAFLPAALARLTIWEACRAAALLDEDEVTAVLEAVRAAFAVSNQETAGWPSRVLGLERHEAPATPGISTAGAGKDISATDVANNAPMEIIHEISTTDVAAIAPWADWLPPMPPELPRNAQALLGWCAALRHAPTIARSPEFGSQVAAWWLASSCRVPQATVHPSVERRPASHPAPARQQTSVPRLDKARSGERPRPLAPLERDDTPRADWDKLFGQEAPVVEGVYTRLGGVLFLIHLMRWLDLPAQWDTCLGSWAALEAIARALLGEAEADDSIWVVLAALDGRSPSTPVGSDVNSAAVFRLPVSWLTRFSGKSRWQVYVEAGHLQIADAGRAFLIVDVPLGDHSPEAALAREIESYRAAGVEIEWEWAGAPFDAERFRPRLSGDAERHIAPAAREWLQRALRFLHWRLSAALRKPSLSPDELAAIILRHSGTLVIGDTHVELYVPPEAADVRLRRAGLDHDPGWLPEFGYIVLFHFSADAEAHHDARTG